jgi:hypothetical protein
MTGIFYWRNYAVNVIFLAITYVVWHIVAVHPSGRKIKEGTQPDRAKLSFEIAATY